jgi:hypothetical protein
MHSRRIELNLGFEVVVAKGANSPTRRVSRASRAIPLSNLMLSLYVACSDQGPDLRMCLKIKVNGREASGESFDAEVVTGQCYVMNNATSSLLQEALSKPKEQGPCPRSKGQ